MITRRHVFRIFGAAGAAAMLPTGHVPAAIAAETGSGEVLDADQMDNERLAAFWRRRIAARGPHLADVQVTTIAGGIKVEADDFFIVVQPSVDDGSGGRFWFGLNAGGGIWPEAVGAMMAGALVSVESARGYFRS